MEPANASAIRAEESEYLAGLDVKVQVHHGTDVSVVLGETLGLDNGLIVHMIPPYITP